MPCRKEQQAQHGKGQSRQTPLESMETERHVACNEVVPPGGRSSKASSCVENMEGQQKSQPSHVSESGRKFVYKYVPLYSQ